MNDQRAKAKQLLMHYLQHAARGNASAFTSNDGYVEVGEIVDLIVDAAAAEAVRIISTRGLATL